MRCNMKLFLIKYVFRENQKLCMLNYYENVIIYKYIRSSSILENYVTDFLNYNTS